MNIISRGIIININLVFESGGIKGLSYVGALKYFEERGYKIYSASGTSVGSIFASLAIAGFKSYEIEKIIDEFDKHELLKLNSFKEGIINKGIYNISGLEKKLDELLHSKGYDTFLDCKVGYDYLLKIVVTDAVTKKMVILPNDLNLYGFSKDNFRISKAVVMSCSIPYFYSTYKLQKYNFVDGGATYRFPIELVRSDLYPTYGLKITSNSRLIEKIIKVLYKTKINEIESLNKIHIININTLNIKSIQFSKGFSHKKELYRAGYMSVKTYFSKN